MNSPEEIIEHIADTGKLYALHGRMLAQCPVKEFTEVCGVYHLMDGIVVYISDFGIEKLEREHDVEVYDRHLTLPEYLEKHGIAHEFKEANP